MLGDPDFVAIGRPAWRDCILNLSRKWLCLLFPPDSQISRETTQFSRDPFTQRPPDFLTALDLKAAPAFATRLFRRAQDRFVFLELRLQRFDLLALGIRLRYEPLQLLVLRVHDELPLGT